MTHRAATIRVAHLDAQLLGFRFEMLPLVTSRPPSAAPAHGPAPAPSPGLIAEIVNCDLAARGQQRVGETDVNDVLLLAHDVALDRFGQQAVGAIHLTRNLLRRAGIFGLQQHDWTDPKHLQAFTGMQPQHCLALDKIAVCVPALFTALRHLRLQGFRPTPLATMSAAVVMAAQPYPLHNVAVGVGLMNWILLHHGLMPVVRLAEPRRYLVQALRTLHTRGSADHLLQYLAESARLNEPTTPR
jgi:hypothetical protein